MVQQEKEHERAFKLSSEGGKKHEKSIKNTDVLGRESRRTPGENCLKIPSRGRR